jgi:glycosyltransferase involved in cell wall biosynthesis
MNHQKIWNPDGWLSKSVSHRNHIAMFLPHLDAGGAERNAVRLANGFVEAGLDVNLVLVRAYGSYMTDLHKRVNVVNLSSKNTYASFPALVRYLRKHPPRLLLSSLDLTNLVAILAGSISKVKAPILIQIRSTVSIQKRTWLKKKLEQSILRLLYPMADGVICVSHGVARDLVDYIGISHEKLCVIYNPIITPELIEKSRQPIEHYWFQQPAMPVILAVGRLSEPKDYPTLFAALKIIRTRHDARLIILGEGEERKDLERLRESLGLNDAVDLPGFVDNPFAYMRKASVLALSSKWEGLPSVLIEAMACGCPVVSTDCPSGPAEILAGGQYGHLAPVGDAQTLAGAIDKVLSGDVRKPPADWLRQFELQPVIQQYLQVMGCL